MKAPAQGLALAQHQQYPIIPIIAIVGGVFVVVSTLITQPKNSIVGLIITLIGLPVYEYMKKKNSNQNNNKVSA